MKRILIVTEHGVPVFDFKEYSRGDEVLVSGLITAILRFAEETEKEKLSRVLLEESQYLLKSKDSLIFVFQVSDDMPNEYAEYVSKCISNSFIENYKDQVESFAGNVSVFQDFQKDCKEILLQCGVDIANILIEDTESQKLKAWCLFSLEYEPLVVIANAPNYNIDSFTIYQVLGKSLRKVSSSYAKCQKGACYHITHQGNVVNTIVLPYVIIIIETKLNELVVKKFRQYKIKSHQQIIDFFQEKFKPDNIEIFNRVLISPRTNQGLSESQKKLHDLFKAAEKGLGFIFNSPIHVQILSTENKSNVIIRLVNRFLLLEYDKYIPSTDLLEIAKKMFEQEVMLKDDIPEAMLER